MSEINIRKFDLIIVGTGSGNSIPGPEFDDWDIAIVEKGVFGGTCLNVGCIPSKMLVYAADVAETIRSSTVWNRRQSGIYRLDRYKRSCFRSD